MAELQTNRWASRLTMKPRFEQSKINTNRQAGISREICKQAGIKKQKVIVQQEARKSSFVEKHSQTQTQSTKREEGRYTGREH